MSRIWLLHTIPDHPEMQGIYSRIVNKSAADPVPPWHLWYILVLLALCHLQKLPFSDWVGGMAIASAIRAGVQIDTGLWLIVLTTANSDKQNLSHENKKDSEVRGVNHIRVHSEAAKLPKH